MSLYTEDDARTKLDLFAFSNSGGMQCIASAY
jgi:hypothetical protein